MRDEERVATASAEGGDAQLEAMIAPEQTTSLLGQTTSRTLLGGAMWRLSSYLLPQAYTLVLSIVAARYLGPTGMGQQSYIAFVALSVSSLAAGGLPTTVMRFVGTSIGRNDTATARTVVRWGWEVVTICAVAGALIVAAPAMAGRANAAAWSLAAVASSLGVANGVPWAVLSALQRNRAAAVWSLATTTAGTAATIVVLAAGKGIVGMFAVEAAAAVVAVSGSIRLATRAMRTLPPDRRLPDAESGLQRRLVRYTVLATVELVLTYVVFRRTELFALRRYSTDRQIALYSIGFAAAGALQQIPLAMQSVLMPALSALWGAGQVDRMRTGVGRVLRLGLLVCAPLACGVAVLGPSALTIVYGTPYRGVGPIVVVLAFAVLVVPLCSVGTDVLGAMGLLRYPIASCGAAVLVDLVLALVLVPAHGATGAAIANVTAQTVAGVPVLFYALRRLQPRTKNVGIIVRSAAVPLIAAAIAWSVDRAVGSATGLVAAAAAGLVTYAAVATIVKVISAEDARWLEQLSATRGRHVVRFVVQRWGERAGYDQTAN